MLQPLLPAEGIADGGLQLAGQFNHFVATFSATISTKDRHRFRFIDHHHQFVEVCIGRSQDGWACNGEVGSLVRSIGGRDIARYGKNGGTLFQNSREDGGADDRAGLLRINQPCSIERSRFKNLYGFSSSSADVSRMLDSTSPAMAITGARSFRASINPLNKWTTPGPAVPQTATGLPVK